MTVSNLVPLNGDSDQFANSSQLLINFI